MAVVAVAVVNNNPTTLRKQWAPGGVGWGGLVFRNLSHRRSGAFLEFPDLVSLRKSEIRRNNAMAVGAMLECRVFVFNCRVPPTVELPWGRHKLCEI